MVSSLSYARPVPDRVDRRGVGAVRQRQRQGVVDLRLECVHGERHWFQGVLRDVSLSLRDVAGFLGVYLLLLYLLERLGLPLFLLVPQRAAGSRSLFRAARLDELGLVLVVFRRDWRSRGSIYIGRRRRGNCDGILHFYDTIAHFG